MAESALDALEEQFPSVIEQMLDEFDSHEFILRLAREHQQLYVLALATYAHTHRPFQVLHGQLARRLHHFPNLVTYQTDRYSQDIFRQQNQAAVWKRRTVEDYRQAFLQIQDQITDKQRLMLQTHYTAPDRITTVSHLANIVGYADYSAANLHYGGLARLIAEAMGYKPPDGYTWLSILVEFQPGNDESRYPMRLMPRVAEALEELGWV